MALILKQLFVSLGDQVRVLRNHNGPARAVTTDYGRFAYGCSLARKASARARMVPTRASYGTRRVNVRILTIPKNTDNPSKKDDFIRTSQGSKARMAPQVLRPGTTRRHYAMLWSHAYERSVCSLVTGLQDTVHVPYRFRASTLGALWIPYGHEGIRTFSFVGIPVRSVVQGLMGSGEARECTLGLYLPNQTRLCDI